MTDSHIDWKEQPVKVGSRVKFGDDDSQIGTVTKITDRDADVDDDTGRGYIVPPKLFIKFDDGSEEYCSGWNSTPAPDWYDEEPEYVWEFEDIEVLKDENAASR